MEDKLHANSFVVKVHNEEKLAIDRANNIRNKYIILRDINIAKKLEMIFRTYISDEDLAKKLQNFYYY